MAVGSFSTLHLSMDSGIARIVFDNPPVNVISATMMRELSEVLSELRDDSDIRVIVFSSANPDYFLAHVDMRIADDLEVLQGLAAEAPTDTNVFQAVGEQLRRQPQVSIVKLTGKARGGGAEFVAAADMAFAARETAAIGQVESLMGIVPSGGGTQFLRERVGRNRALEVVLTGDALDADTAELYGWINRSVPAINLDAFVESVAQKIAGLPAGIVVHAKSVLAQTDLSRGYLREQAAWSELVTQPTAQRLMSEALRRGAQTPEGEADLESLLRETFRQLQAEA